MDHGKRCKKRLKTEQKRRKNACKTGASIALAGVIALSSTVWGLGGMEARAAQVLSEELYEAADGNRITNERLEDHTIEYEELGSLIHANNVTVQNITSSLESSKQWYTDDLSTLIWGKYETVQKKDDAEDEGDMESYAEYASSEAIYKSSIKSYKKMLDSLDDYSANRSRLLVERQLTNGAQSLMISYQSIQLQKEYLQKMAELFETQYENAKLQQQAGLGSDQDVNTAQNSWKSALSSLASLEASEKSIYQSLCAMLGVDTDGSMEIKTDVAVDLQQIEDMDLELDTQKAINNNSDIINARHTSSGNTTSGVNRKSRTVTELEENLTVTMKQLYENVNQAKTAYDAAKTGYQSAEISWGNTKNKNKMGMLSNAQFIQEEMQYIQKKTNYETAELNLFQALENYKWAVKGVVSL